jgi:hypothetical protein
MSDVGKLPLKHTQSLFDSMPYFLLPFCWPKIQSAWPRHMQSAIAKVVVNNMPTKHKKGKPGWAGHVLFLFDMGLDH